jgi:signal transduction histidine kinase
MLSRSLQTDIEVTVDMPEQLWPVAIDPAEFELALLNIGVNARDAMPEGGRLRVTANNVIYRSGTLESDGLRGDFVAVMLSDTGTGMSPDVLAQAFEPILRRRRRTSDRVSASPRSMALLNRAAARLRSRARAAKAPLLS